MTTTTRTDTIRALNDRLRTTLRGGRVTMTCGVQALAPDRMLELMRALRTFDAFDGGNDPHQEHDFGAVDLDGEKFYFKIDYYDATMDYGSEDPADPEKTTRVMTVMRAAEY